MREFTRVLKEQLVDKTGIDIEAHSGVTLWMIRWAAMLCSRYLVGKDGRTPYERRRGRKCKMPVICFGEKVWYKELRETKERKDKFESEWAEGIWLGHSRASNEMLIGTREGVVRAYAVKRQDEDQRWDGSLIKEMKGTPQQPNPNKPGMTIPIKIRFDEPEAAEPIPSVPAREEKGMRRMGITEALLKKYGYTEDCEGCKAKAAGIKEARKHTEECRRRIDEAMEEDGEGKERKRTPKREKIERSPR